MTDASDILVVAATSAELCGRQGLVCGVGPVESAIAVTQALARRTPGGVLHVGIAGAHRASGLAVAALVVGRVAVYEDLALTTGLAPREVEPDPTLAAAVKAALPQAVELPIGTVGRVGAGGRCPVEAMEGFAVLRAAQRGGVPAVELRAISNLVEDARADWRIDEALAALARALAALGL